MEANGKLLNNSVLKTEDIHPPKTGISVHSSGSSAGQAPPY